MFDGSRADGSRADGSGGNELTANARRGIALAQDAARRLGHEHVDSGDLLLGLLAEKEGLAAAALVELGVRSAGVTAAIAVLLGSRTDQRSSESPFTDDTLAVLRSAARQSLRDDRGVTTGDLLLGMVATPAGVGGRVLAALGIAPDQVRTTVARLADARPEGMSLSDAVAAAPLGPVPPLPGLAAAAGSLAATATVFLGLATIVALSVPIAEDPVIVGVAMALSTVVQLVAAVVVPFAAILRRGLATRARRRLTTPGPLADLMRRHGVRRLDLRARTGRSGGNRSYRIGGQAWIVLAPATIHDPAALAFALSHEVAHVLRHDSRRRQVELILTLSLIYGAVVAGTGLGWAVAAGGGLLLWFGPRWGAEFAADAVAVRWAGLAAMRRWAGALGRQPGRGLLTHPPLGLRLRRAAAIVQG